MMSDHVASRLRPFGETIFTEMSALALRHRAVNLGQGFPNWDGAAFVKEAAVRAIMDGGTDQYPPSMGVPALRHALAAHYGPRLARRLDPDREITVTSGCTEALAAACLGLLEPGDEVVLIDPTYDAYAADVALAGAVARHVVLRPPEFRLTRDLLAAAITDSTRLVIVNTPHNPTGRVFTSDELGEIADLCVQHDAVVIADEVYEEMTYGSAHHSIASLPGMWERTLTLSSLGKTFSLTGWKVGWAIGPPTLTRAVRAAHQFLTFTTPTPVQYGAAAALDADPSFYEQMRAGYRTKRDLLAEGLDRLGFEVYLPEGTYFLLADHRAFGYDDDRAFCRYLVEEVGVAAIPPSAFYRNPADGASLVRFAFCKDDQTLREALRRLEKLVR